MSTIQVPFGARGADARSPARPGKKTSLFTLLRQIMAENTAKRIKDAERRYTR